MSVPIFIFARVFLPLARVWSEAGGGPACAPRSRRPARRNGRDLGPVARPASVCVVLAMRRAAPLPCSARRSSPGSSAGGAPPAPVEWRREPCAVSTTVGVYISLSVFAVAIRRYATTIHVAGGPLLDPSGDMPSIVASASRPAGESKSARAVVEGVSGSCSGAFLSRLRGQ